MQTLNRILIALALVPLAQTSWADEMRITPSDRSQQGRPESLEALPSGIRFLVGLIRPMIVLLIPGSITLGILNVIRCPYKQAPVNIGVKPVDR